MADRAIKGIINADVRDRQFVVNDGSFGDNLRDSHSRLADYIAFLPTQNPGYEREEALKSEIAKLKQDIADYTDILNREIDVVQFVEDGVNINMGDSGEEEEARKGMIASQKKLGKIEFLLSQHKYSANADMADALRTVLLQGFEVFDREVLSEERYKALKKTLIDTCSYTGYIGEEDDDVKEGAEKSSVPIVDLHRDNGMDKRILDNYASLTREATYLFTIGGTIDTVRVMDYLVRANNADSYLTEEIESMVALNRVGLNPVVTWYMFKREFSGTALRIYRQWVENRQTITGVALIEAILETTGQPTHMGIDTHSPMIDLLQRRYDAKDQYDDNNNLIIIETALKRVGKMKDDSPIFQQLKHLVDGLVLNEDDVKVRDV